MARNKDTKDTPPRDQHVCPNDGSTMIARPLPEQRELTKSMIEQGSPHYYADNFASTVHEKQAEVGVLYVCPMCKYQDRVKDAA